MFRIGLRIRFYTSPAPAHGNRSGVRHASCFWLLLPCLLPSVAGCQDVRAPELNPDPKHVVRIVGRVPASLEFGMLALYAPSAETKECTIHSWLQYADPRTYTLYERTHLLDVKRVDGRYQTSFVVDKYLPGECKWQLSGVIARIIRDGNTNDIDTVGVIDSDAYYAPDYKDACIGKEKATCEAARNSRETPVIVPCEMFLYDKPMPGAQPGTIIQPDKEPSLFCRDRSVVDGPHKQEHLLTKDTKQVQVDFYDLETEPDPTIPLSANTGSVP